MLTIDDSVNNILEDKKQFWLKVSLLEGKNLRVEREVQHLSAKVEDLQCQDMRENLVFYHLQEQGDDCEQVVLTFLHDEMGIPQEYIYSKENLGGEIRIDDWAKKCMCWEAQAYCGKICN